MTKYDELTAEVSKYQKEVFDAIVDGNAQAQAEAQKKLDAAFKALNDHLGVEYDNNLRRYVSKK